MSATICNLLFSFLQIGLFSIGGGYATIPLIQQQVIYHHHWLTMQEFTDIITISQMTPGPLAVNTSTFVGIRIGGLPGAVVATFGCIFSGFLISIFLYRFFCKHQNIQSISFLLKGLQSVSIGFIASSAGTILLMALFNSASPSFSDFNLLSAVICIGSLLLLKIKKINPMLLILLSGCFGLLFY